MFYTYIERVDNRLFHRFVDNEGARKKEVIRNFDFDVYLPSKHGEHQSLDGTRLSHFKKNSISELLSFTKEMSEVQPIYGMTDPLSQFLAKTYPGNLTYDFKKFKILSFDIETRFDGYEIEDEVRVRKSFSNHEEIKTVAWVRAHKSDGIYEVFDQYNDRWYPIGECPQLMDGGFPDPEKAEYEVTTISMKRFGVDQTFVIGTKPFKSVNGVVYIRVDDEIELLKEFIDLIGKIEPDILTGWNIEGFDIPYLVNRINSRLGEEWSNKLSPFHRECSKCISESFSSTSSEQIYKILGITVFDYMTLYKNFNLTKYESYALDFIAQEEGVGSKVDYGEHSDLMEFYLKDYQRFVEYNAEDSVLVEKLDQKRQYIRLAITTVLMTHSRFSDVHGKVKLWDNLIYNMALSENKVIPPQNRVSGDKIIGAFVKDAVPGKYRWIVSLDLTSLYPSICMMFNMSPETLVESAKGKLKMVQAFLDGEDLASDARSRGYCMTANGAVFSQDFEGVMPRAMKYVFDTRKAYKKEMLSHEKDLEKAKAENAPTHEIIDKIAASNAAQGAMKVLANSGYGCLANAGFRYFNHDIAEGITLTGQLGIQYIGNFANEFLNERFGKNKDWVLVSDTDSIYLVLDDILSDPLDTEKSLVELEEFVTEILQPEINNAFARLGEKMGAKKSLLDMKLEAIGDVGFFRGKKNYAINLLFNEGVRFNEPKLKIMGLEPVRSDRPKVVRSALKKAVELILNGSVEDVRKFSKAFEKEFLSLPIEDMATPKGISNMEKYNSGNGMVPWHVKAANIHNKMVDDLGLNRTIRKLKAGGKVKIVNLKKANPTHSNAIAFLGKLPEEFGLREYVDTHEMFDKAFKVPLNSYCEAVGWVLEKKASLEDLFG